MRDSRVTDCAEAYGEIVWDPGVTLMFIGGMVATLSVARAITYS